MFADYSLSEFLLGEKEKT